MHRLRTELAADPAAPLGILSETGGTVLIPEPETGDTATVELFERLQNTARVPLLATMVHAQRREIPEAAHRTHEMLEPRSGCTGPPASTDSRIWLWSTRFRALVPRDSAWPR